MLKLKIQLRQFWWFSNFAKFWLFYDFHEIVEEVFVDRRKRGGSNWQWNWELGGGIITQTQVNLNFEKKGLLKWIFDRITFLPGLLSYEKGQKLSVHVSTHFGLIWVVITILGFQTSLSNSHFLNFRAKNPLWILVPKSFISFLFNLGTKVEMRPFLVIFTLCDISKIPPIENSKDNGIKESPSSLRQIILMFQFVRYWVISWSPRAEGSK